MSPIQRKKQTKELKNKISFYEREIFRELTRLREKRREGPLSPYYLAFEDMYKRHVSHLAKLDQQLKQFS
jgi:hypothetical protein